MQNPPRRSRRRSRLLALLAVAIAALTAPAVVPGLASAVTATIDGTPLRVLVYDGGNLQGNLEQSDNNIFYDPDSEVGDAGFFLGLPEQVGTVTAGTVFGPEIEAGDPTDVLYRRDSQTAVTGAGTALSPFTVVTVYTAVDPAPTPVDLLEVTQTITYVNGQRRFRASYAVKNETSNPIRFRASTGADLYLDGSDEGLGFFSTGPPRFVGGQSEISGRSGGIEEVTGSEWSKYQETAFDDIWDLIGDAASGGFDDSISTTLEDNGVGVQWDEHYGVGQGLAGGATDTYEVVWRLGVAGLTITPQQATRTQGQNHVVSFAAVGPNGDPQDNVPIRYVVNGANPRSAAVTTSATGAAQATLTGTNAGEDVLTAFVDLNSNTTREANEPVASALVEWLALPTNPAAPPDSDGDGVPDASDACPTFAAPGGCPPAATASLNATTAAVRAAFNRLGLGTLLRAGAVSFGFTAPGAGTLTGEGTANVASSGAAKKVVLLKGKKSFSKAGKGKVKLKLTKKGKRALKKLKKVTIRLTLKFTDKAGRTYNKKITVKVKRKKAKKKKG